jgi:[ribosomal protein S5]-alanine N-acetyltransferase
VTAAPATFDTERLRLRPPVLDDASAIFALYAQDPEVTRYLTWRPHPSVETTRAFLQRCADVRAAGTAFPWLITLPATGEPVGMIELRMDGHRADLGYVIGRPFWGRGFATEATRAVVDWALAQPAIHRVWAVCDVENRASARVLEKAGLQREGVLRRWMPHPNASDDPRDCFCFSRVR